MTTPNTNPGSEKLQINRLKCWWLGCESQPYDYTCARCEQEIDYGQTGMKWRMRLWLRDKVDSLRRYFGKCPECGKRFGRHDDSIFHCPF